MLVKFLKKPNKKSPHPTSDQSVPGMRDAAIGYAKIGLQVVLMHNPVKVNDLTVCSCAYPECPSIGKHPATEHGWKDATDDQKTIGNWFKGNPHANIGIATGKESGVVVLDIDPKNGGEESLEQLQDDHGMLPKTWTVNSGGGGRHFIFRYPETGLKTSHGALGPGVDVQSDGALVVAPPSLHASGERYSFRKGLDPNSIDLAAFPTWLTALLHTNAQHAPTPVQDWRDLVAMGVKEGARNVALARLAGHLFQKDIDAIVVLDLLQSWNKSGCHPPLQDSEVWTIVDNIAGRELAGKRR